MLLIMVVERHPPKPTATPTMMMYQVPISRKKVGNLSTATTIEATTTTTITTAAVATVATVRPHKGITFNKHKDSNELCECVNKSNRGNIKIFKVGKDSRENLHRVADELMATNLVLVL